MSRVQPESSHDPAEHGRRQRGARARRRARRADGCTDDLELVGRRLVRATAASSSSKSSASSEWEHCPVVARGEKNGGFSTGWVPSNPADPEAQVDVAARSARAVDFGEGSMEAPSAREVDVGRDDLEDASARSVAARDARRRRALFRALENRLPLEVRAALVVPAGRAVAGLAVIVFLGLLVALAFWHVSRPVIRAAPAVQRTQATAKEPPLSGKSAAPSTPSVDVTVHVAGAVRRPGIVRLPPGSRVADAVEMVGGPAPKAALASVNLARLLVDGEQVVVLTTGQVPPGPVAATAATPGTAGGAPGGELVDLNTATLEQLDDLPGVGPVLAQRIADWRTRNGRFSAVAELREVTGIGEAKFADLQPRVRV